MRQCHAESGSIEHHAPRLQHHSGSLVDHHRRMPLLLQAQQEAIQADYGRFGKQKEIKRKNKDKPGSFIPPT